MKIRTFLSIAAIPALLLAGPALAAPQNTGTPANEIHPQLLEKVGQGDGTNANPNGVNPNGGDLHNINAVNGHDGDNPNDDGVNGQANELDEIHGGVSGVNPVAAGDLP